MLHIFIQRALPVSHTIAVRQAHHVIIQNGIRRSLRRSRIHRRILLTCHMSDAGILPGTRKHCLRKCRPVGIPLAGCMEQSVIIGKKLCSNSSCQLSGGGRMLAWANSHHRCVVRFDPRPFGSDAPSQPRRGVYVKERSFAFLFAILSNTMHNSLCHKLLSDNRKMYYFCYPLIYSIKKDGFSPSHSI